MFRNYAKIAFRNLLKHKGYSFINVAGLAVGMACCIFIMLYVQYELSYDEYHEHADRIYRVSRQWFNSDGESSLHLGHVAPPIGPLLASDYPEIEQMVRIIEGYGPLMSYGDTHFQEDRFFFADPNIFEVFTLPFVSGDPATALQQPNDLIITESIAKKYFGAQDPLNKVMTFEIPGEVKTDLRITGVMRDMPENSHFHLDFVGSMNALQQALGPEEFQSWGSNNYATYLLLRPEASPETLEARFPDFLNRHYAAYILEQTGNAPSTQPSVRNKLHLWPLTDIHLHSQLDSEIEANGNITYVYIFVSVAFFILLIACINFMNLATARSAKRMKEVGLRKVVGADRKRLILQFLSESVLTAFVALALAFLCVKLTLPWFNDFVGQQFALEGSYSLMLSLLAIALFVGLAAGSYPALYLSGFQPVNVLKTSVRGCSKSTLRKTLVVFQFAISIILIISMGIVYSQLEYCSNKNLGLDKDKVVVLPIGQEMLNNFDDIKNQLKQHPQIVNVAGSKRIPSGRLLDSSGARIIDGGRNEPVSFRIANVRVDHGFLDTYSIELAAGRDFSLDFPTDSSEAFILNETAVRKLGWNSPQDAVDKPFEYGGQAGRIIGVVKDFHYESLHQPITPIVLVLQPSSFNRLSVKFHADKAGDIENVIAFLKEKWQAYRPNMPFTYTFLNQSYAELYGNEQKLGEIFTVFSALAIFIACLGLFGFASYMAEQRTKEIGVRKVLGATIPRIALLLTSEFVILVGVASLLAWAVAFYTMREWLLGFAYRIDISGQIPVFVVASIVALVIAVATVSYQAMRAALTNPVEALRYE